MGDAVGARRSGSELASLTPKRVCSRTGTIEHWRPTEPGSPRGDLPASPCSAEVFSITDGYDADTEARTTALTEALATRGSCTDKNGGEGCNSSTATPKGEIGAGQPAEPYSPPGDQPLITDCFQFTDPDTVHIRPASADEVAWIWHVGWVNYTGGWLSAKRGRAIRNRACELGIGIYG